mgnify:CR=1 FL=1
MDIADPGAGNRVGDPAFGCEGSSAAEGDDGDHQEQQAVAQEFHTGHLPMDWSDGVFSFYYKNSSTAREILSRLPESGMLPGSLRFIDRLRRGVTTSLRHRLPPIVLMESMI